MKAIMTGVALAALLAGTPAFAAGKLQQIAQADQPGQMQEMQNAPACPEGTACGPDTTGSLPTKPSSGDSVAAPAEPPVVTADNSGKFFNEQDDSAVLASELTGKTVYDSADNSLGDVNDIIWTEDGTIQGVVVGVGGFLGIGEKNVAVNYDALNITTDEDGNRKLVLDATADELAAAPEFVTTQQKLAELRAQQPPAADQGTGAVAPIQQPQAPAQ